MGMPVEKYNIGDLEKYAKFRQANPDIGTLDCIRLYNLKRQEDNKVFVKNFMQLMNNMKKRKFKSWSFGDHVTLTYAGFEFAFQIGYSYDVTEQDSNIIIIQFTFLTFEIRF